MSYAVSNLSTAQETLMLSRLAEFVKAFYENPKNQKAYKAYKEEVNHGTSKNRNHI